MKIALISEHASPLALLGGTDSGGQNVYVANVARELARQGHHVDVFTRRESEEQPLCAAFAPGVRVVHIDAGPACVMPKEKLLPHMAEFSANLLDFYRVQMRDGAGYAVTHANFFMSGMAGLAAKDALGVPLVITFHALGKVRRLHQGADDGFPLERFAIEEDLVARADHIVAECPQDLVDLRSLYGADPARVSVVPCGFDAREFYPVRREEARAKLGWLNTGFSILQLGRLVPRKGIDNVIRALATLRYRHGDRAMLYVVGGNSESPDETATPEIARLRSVARSTGVADCVEFVGRRARNVLRLYYAACDVFVTTPWYEPFGITPVEAMACARPVIGAEVGGIRSTVVHNRTGFLVPPKDPDALALRLHELAIDAKRRAAFAEAGHARARSLYTWAQVVRDLEAVFIRSARTTAPKKVATRRPPQPQEKSLSLAGRGLRPARTAAHGMGTRKLG